MNKSSMIFFVVLVALAFVVVLLNWTAKDAVRFVGSPGNLYAYAGNDPVNERDLSGTYGNWTPNPDGTQTYHTDSFDIPQDVQDMVDRGEADVQITPPESSTWKKFMDWLNHPAPTDESGCLRTTGGCQGRKAAESGAEAEQAPGSEAHQKALEEYYKKGGSFMDWLNAML